MFEPPQLAALRIVFGVGSASGEPPDAETFRPTYTVNMPIFSMGGLDPDGVYEFDAGMLLDAIRKRALRRAWGVRLEIELTQAAESVPHADLYIDAPFGDDPASPSIQLLGRSGRGITLPGGARTLVIGTSIVHDSKRAALLSGVYTAQLRDVEPEATARPGSRAWSATSTWISITSSSRASRLRRDRANHCNAGTRPADRRLRCRQASASVASCGSGSSQPRCSPINGSPKAPPACSRATAPILEILPRPWW